MKNIKILGYGGRAYPDGGRVSAVLDALDQQEHISVVVHGDAGRTENGVVVHGADRLCGEWARRRGRTERSYPALWWKQYRAAGPIRNSYQLIEELDGLEFGVEFPGGVGTKNMRDKLLAFGVRVIQVLDIGGTQLIRPPAIATDEMEKLRFLVKQEAERYRKEK